MKPFTDIMRNANPNLDRNFGRPDWRAHQRDFSAMSAGTLVESGEPEAMDATQPLAGSLEGGGDDDASTPAHSQTGPAGSAARGDDERMSTPTHPPGKV
jgi:hypothetical protein